MVGVEQPFMSVELQGKWPSGQVTGQVPGQSRLLVPIILGMQVSGPLQPLTSS
jgi:hypothetical protein